MDWDTPPVRKRNETENTVQDKVQSLDSSVLLKRKFSNTGIIVLTIIAVIVLVSAFVIRPALIGYSVYRQADQVNFSISELGANVLELRSQLASTKANLTLYSEVYNRVWTEVEQASTDLAGCQADKSSLQLDIENLEHQSDTQLTECESKNNEATAQINLQLAEKDKKIAEADEKLKKLKSDYDEFVFNIARNVCCKAKVDNPSVNSYEVSNKRLVCLEDGEISLNC